MGLVTSVESTAPRLDPEDGYLDGLGPDAAIRRGCLRGRRQSFLHLDIILLVEMQRIVTTRCHGQDLLIEWTFTDGSSSTSDRENGRARMGLSANSLAGA